MLDAQPPPGAQQQQQQQPLQNGAAGAAGHQNGGPAAARPQPMQLPGERAQRWLTPEVRPSSMWQGLLFQQSARLDLVHGCCVVAQRRSDTDMVVSFEYAAGLPEGAFLDWDAS